MIRLRASRIQKRHSDFVDRSRSGFTLFELIIVLAIIATLASMAVPRMTRFLNRQSIQANAEEVRQLLDHARVRAIEEGRPLQARYEPNGRKFVLLPQFPGDGSNTSSAGLGGRTSSGASATGSSTQTGSTKTWAGRYRLQPFRVFELTDDCQFYQSSALLDPNAQRTERLPQEWLQLIEGGSTHRDVNWSQAIVFYPDGTATDSQLTLMDKKNHYIKFWVRGLTGAVSTTDVAKMSETPGATPQ